MNMAQAYALKRALEDTDFRHGLAEFFSEQATYAKSKCAEALVKEDYFAAMRAARYAAHAQFAEEGLVKLEEFTRDELSKV